MRFLTDSHLCQTLLEVLEHMRKEFRLCVYGFVVMPEHVHLLLSEPDRATLADFMHSLKLSFSKRVRSQVSSAAPREPGAPTVPGTSRAQAPGTFWQKRYYDRNIRSYSDFVEKLRYIHRNPVKRGLCARPEDWPWSSFRHYATGEVGVVEIESEWTARRRATGPWHPTGPG